MQRLESLHFCHTSKQVEGFRIAHLNPHPLNRFFAPQSIIVFYQVPISFLSRACMWCAVRTLLLKSGALFIRGAGIVPTSLRSLVFGCTCPIQFVVRGAHPTTKIGSTFYSRRGHRPHVASLPSFWLHLPHPVTLRFLLRHPDPQNHLYYQRLSARTHGL